MMEDGRGSSIPRVKGVAKNGNTWIPLTPDKSFLQSSINDQSEMKQNQMGDENWHNLMDIYGEVLRNNQCHNFNLNGEGLDYGEGKHEGVPQAENCSRLQQYSQYVAPVEVYCGVPLNSDPNGFTGVNNVEHSNQNLSKLNKFGILNQNAGIIGSYTSNVGEVSSSQGVGLSAELMSIIHARCACPPEGSQVAYASVGERIQQSHVLHGSKQVDYAKVGAEFQQSHNSYENHDGGGYSQQEIPKSKPSVAKDTLNRTLRSEARESSSVSRSSPLGPVTPDQQNQSKTHHILQVPHFFIEDASTSKKYIHGSILLPSESEILEKDHGGTSANSISTSSTAGSSTSPLDMRCSDGGNGGIDLNKTPQQKTPKRVKHRPKVVVEGKPKRSPKPASTKRNTHDGNCPSKRKYVRKNGTKNSNPPTADTLNVIEASDMGAATKSCKRKLNFDMETGADNRAEKEGQGRQPVQPDNQEQNNECHKLSLDSSEPSLSAAGAGYCDAYNKERRQSPMAYNSVHSVIRSPLESCNGNNLNAIARDSSMRNASLHQSIKESQHNQVHYHSNGSHPLLVFQAYPYEQNLGFRELSSVQTTHGALEDRMDTTNKKASSRACKHTVIGSPQTIQLMGSQLCPYGVTDWQIGSEKFDKIIDKLHGTSFSMDSDLTTCEESIQQTENRSKSFMGQNSTEPQNGESRDSVLHKFQQQYASSQVHPPTKILLPKTFQNSVDTQITKSMTADINWNLGSASNRDPLSIPINRNINYPRHVVVKNRSARVTSYKKAPGVDQVIQIEPNNKRSRGISSKEVAGIKLVSVDDIMDGMKNLRINNSGKELVWKEQSALVSYRRDGVVIPHEGFDIVKKRLPRPRVDLDPETNRLWNLLMGNEGDGSAEKMDPHKEKWWDEERKVFRGRVDSFIARMHLVQGDRRFSKWKGSVVDSVIGVFLTQNVSDHLSSSAFMSLAAKFPSKSTAAGEPCCGDGRSRTVRNHDVRITYPDGTTFHQKMVMEPVNSNSLVTSAEKAKHWTDNVLPEKETSQTNDHTRRTVDDIISSQNSSESFVLHASEDVRSSSGSNSDAECGWTISKNVGQVSVTQQAKRIDELLENTFQIKEISCTTKNLIDHQKCETQEYVQSPGWANIANVQHHQNSVPPFTDSCSNLALGMQIWEEDGISILGRESISTLTSKYSKETGARNMDDYRGQSAESASEDGRSEFQTSAVNHAVPKGGLELQNDFINESDRSSQHLIKNMSEKLNPFHQEDTLLRDPRRPSNAFSKQSTEPSEIQKPTEVVTDKGQRQSSEKLSSEISVSTPIARKRKAEKEKVETCNWDTLRKQVYLKTGKTERSREAVDSLDYEALHNADVHEVSDTIKERGMNNKLAERMKNFLNRLVEDHEEIDLEWLRDVEPDKAKDYLLSVQGLGLKSVECVRLLTLHHLAFPVDTNVGRIAVRLGWVPLQPLPESLQLHLLELYPILESIQKYLWPRLCKLDQETLYELHYQMITFGKVFCTKRDPNCNACPMRGECRHFASAFASARFSLPGPQERHIVSSAAPMCGNKSSDMKIKPMPLLPSGDTMEQGVRLSNDCEPVIEEPKTPEPPAEVEERDIEDAFYEEPDEIPVIKLNIEEFTSNIQSLIQEKIDIGEEMSKALVALNPGFASIPTTKLKHVSRLRTEHQVYELPDSHPLLQGMDRREPDDPSPYLLAIWTPGETADSFQAPESRCRSMEGGGLCNNETCFSCNSRREAEAQTVRGTILIPCRTATRGSFPLNGTYFQVNEVFADHESSLNPIDVPRNILWNLPRRTVFFGSSVTSIFKGLSTEEIQFCFWKGFVCVRGFDQKTRAPRPLKARLHLPASKMAKRNEEL